MGKTTLKMTLSPGSVRAAARHLDRYKRQLNDKIVRLMNRIVADAAESARVKVVQMDAVMYGDLLNSIGGVYDPVAHVGVVYAGSPHAIYVEYGTGIVGAAVPHPEPVSAYDGNNHGDAGWWYWSEQDNNWHWTKGMPSRPFMWQTAREMPQIIDAAKKAVFG